MKKPLDENNCPGGIFKETSVKDQLSFFTVKKNRHETKTRPTFEKLVKLLESDLNFHNQASNYYSHNFHSFPAKFPPQLPKFFIEELTNPNDIVLDPMVGSGTTMVESFFAQRQGIGFDIDPLALKISQVKTTPYNRKDLAHYGSEIYTKAKYDFNENKDQLLNLLTDYFDEKTRDFLDYWFLEETQLELISLWNHINKISDKEYKSFFQVIFSSVIITKSGGVSLALDLGHTRPHKVKALLDVNGNIISGDNNVDVSKKRYLAKNVKSAFDEFLKRFNQNKNRVIPITTRGIKPVISFCDSQKMHLDKETVDLIITSPPYASNAIDYMRAHKFSLIWFGYKIEELTKKRNDYIGSETTANYRFEDLSPLTNKKIDELSNIAPNRGKVLRRYFSEMKKSLQEMYRVLKPGKAAIVVVGSSIMKGIDTETHQCLKEIVHSIGFNEPHIGVRKLDRNKRMLPASLKKNLSSQIQRRMHEEYVIGFYKPSG